MAGIVFVPLPRDQPPDIQDWLRGIRQPVSKRHATVHFATTIFYGNDLNRISMAA